MDSEQSKIEQELDRIRQEARNCPATGELTDYLFGDLAEEQSLLVEYHVANCPECTQVMAQMDVFEEPAALKKEEDRQLEADYQELGRRLGYQSKSGFRWSSLFRWIWTVRTPLLVPVGITIGLLAMFIFQGGDKPAVQGPAVIPVVLDEILVDLTTSRGAEEMADLIRRPPDQLVHFSVELDLEPIGYAAEEEFRIVVVGPQNRDSVPFSRMYDLDSETLGFTLRVSEVGIHRVILYYGQSETPFDEFRFTVP